MPTKLLADHNLRRMAILLFRNRGHDIVTARELGLDRASDGHLLLTAAGMRRTLLTANIDDFVLLHDAWRRWTMAWAVDAEHAGVIILPQDQDWDAARTVAEVESIVGPAGADEASGPLRNRLWQWRPSGRWRLDDGDGRRQV